MKKHRRILSLVLALVLCLGIMAVPAHAETVTTKEYDDEGNVVREWTIDTETGTATPVESPAPEETTPPAEPSQPVQPVTPTEPPAEPTEPTQPTEPTKPTGPVTFTDVPADAWYAEAVNALADGGLIQGDGNGHFNPDGLVTYGELAAVIARLYLSKDYVYETVPLHGHTGYGNAECAYGYRYVSMAHLDEDLIGNYCNGLPNKYPASHWATHYNYYVSTELITMVEPEDLDVPAIRASAISLIAYSAMYAKAGAPEYVNCYAPGDIPDWNDVLGVGHTVLRPAGHGTREEGSLKTRYEWPIDDELHFLPDCYVVSDGTGERLRGYDMEWVKRNDLDGQTYVHAYPDLILKAYNMGLTNGVDDTHACDVYGHLTRAELAVLLYRAGLTERETCNWPKKVGSYVEYYPDGETSVIDANTKYYR